MNHSETKFQIWRVSFCALVLSACVSVPPPTEQMASAKAAVADAISAGAPELTPPEIKRAQAKLDDANTAMAAKEYSRARRLSEQAELDAKLASIKARTVKAQREVADHEQNIRALQSELNRKAP